MKTIGSYEAKTHLPACWTRWRQARRSPSPSMVALSRYSCKPAAAKPMLEPRRLSCGHSESGIRCAASRSATS